jgi:hypothetical protein
LDQKRRGSLREAWGRPGGGARNEPLEEQDFELPQDGDEIVIEARDL